MANFNIAIHGAHESTGGIYNVLGSFAVGLLNGFNNININAYSTYDCAQNNIPFHLAIGFNSSGYALWNNILQSNTYNIMWSVDSIFAQNYQVIKQYQNDPKFLVFTVWLDDIRIAKQLMPNLQLVYLPHATDTKLWENKPCQKDIDIVFLSSVNDYEKQFEEQISKLPNDKQDTLREMYNILVENPEQYFFDVYCDFCKNNNFLYSADIFSVLKQLFLPVVESALKVKMIKKLKDFPIKIYGNETWKKYISDKQEYCGAINLTESINVIRRSKICLHPHFGIFGGGLHERLLNATSVGTFVLSNNDKVIQQNFNDTFGYFDYENICDQVNYYLKNEEERQTMTQEAYKIVCQKHTWTNRASEIIQMIV